jgi:perosamine synthetase
MSEIHMAGPWITDLEKETVLDAMNHWYDDCYYYCETFQDEFAEYHDRKYGIMTPNCTTSLHLLLTGLGIGHGDEVIVPECTWIASTSAIIYLGATPVFCDIDPDNWCLDPVSVKKAITPKTKAIIVVDIFGNMPDMDELTEVAKENNIYLIEDAAEALGSVYKGKRAGKFGIGSTFSFHRTKTITTGEGGMLLLDERKLYERCMLLRDHGRGPKTKPYLNEEVTYKYTPFNVQAAIGYAQFKRIDELVGRKREQLNLYRKCLSDIEDLYFNPEPPDGINGAWITTLVFGKSHNITKNQAIDKMAKMGLPLRPFFYPLSSIPAYSKYKAKYEKLNIVAYDISNRGVNLPGAASVDEKQITQICDGIKNLL